MSFFDQFRSTFWKYWGAVRSSYWFIPLLMSFGALVMAFLLPQLDSRLGADWIEGVGWLYANKPAGARAVLSTIAGSMIGVAGVTFSITIAAVSFTSGQYGPRILTNFMSDTGNQVTLGTFISAFLYCLLVLRTVRGADEGGLEEAVVGAFVPHLAIIYALVLALAGVGVLIYFIHHIPESIHISNVIADIGLTLNTRLHKRFPDLIGAEEPDPPPVLPEGFPAQAAAVIADGEGYIQHLEDRQLVVVAEHYDLLLRVRYRPGDFVSRGKALVRVWPAERLTEEITDLLREAFIWGRHRTQYQDVRFLADELVEIAARALSPGVNDPFTAINCLDWLSSSLSLLAQRATPDAYRYDRAGTLRVVADPTGFEQFADLIFGQLRPYVRADRNAALHTFKVMGEVALEVDHPQQRAVLKAHADALMAGCQEALGQEVDREEVAARYRAVLRVLHPERPHQEAEADNRWLGGTA